MSEPFDASTVDIPNLFKWVIVGPDDGVLDLNYTHPFRSFHIDYSGV